MSRGNVFARELESGHVALASLFLDILENFGRKHGRAGGFRKLRRRELLRIVHFLFMAGRQQSGRNRIFLRALGMAPALAGVIAARVPGMVRKVFDRRLKSGG